MSTRARNARGRGVAVPASASAPAAAGSKTVVDRHASPEPETGEGRTLLARAWAAASRHPTLGAALLIGSLVLVYLWPALVGGGLLSPISMLYLFPPWQQAAPPDLASYLNPLLSDVAMSHYPWNVFARASLHDGQLPLWSPHAFAGVPFLANPQTVVFSPFSLPMWLLPLNYGIGLAAALKLWAAGFATYLLARELRLGFLAGLLAGVGYALCSFHVVWLTHETLPAVSAMLPWMLWLAERALSRRSTAAVLGLAGVTAIALTGGHPGTQVHVLAAVAFFAMIRCATVRDLSRRERIRRAATVLGGLVAGGLLAAVIFLPELLSSRGTLGTEARRAGEATSPGVHMPVNALLTTLFPDWWGRPSGTDIQPTTGAIALTNYNERTFYAGVVVLLFAAIGALAPGGWRRKGPFLALTVLSLAVALRAPGLRQVVEHLPGFAVIQNQRIHFVFELGAAVLAAFGLQSLLDRPREVGWQIAVPLLALSGALAAVVAIGPSGRAMGDTVKHFTTGRDFADGAVVSLTSVAWMALFALAVAVALIAWRRWPQRRNLIAALLVLVAALDALHFAHGYQPIAPASKSVPPRTKGIDYLAARADDGRFVGIGWTLPNAWSGLYGLRDVRGYDPPQPSMRFFRLWQKGNSDQLNWAPFQIQSLTPFSIQVVSILGARYVIGPPGLLDLPHDSREYRWLRRVYAGDDATIFENRAAAPRVELPRRIVVTGDEDETLDALISDQFDPWQDVVVERGADGVEALAAAPVARGSVHVEDETATTVTLAADLDRRGLVVLNDNLTDGWTVRVDGREQAPILVNDVMRGVVVDAGRHEITWSYATPGLKLGAIVTGATLLTLLSAAGALVVRVRRRPHDATR